jgi:protocatechuate 3,4-dioxygenase beta subunit
MRNLARRSTRRTFIRWLLAMPLALAVATRLRRLDALAVAEARAASPDVRARAARPGGIAATPDCGDEDDPTPAETAGPFFKPRSPLRTSLLETGLAGTRIVVSGRVFSRHCRALAGVLVDFWHADDAGLYDNAGFKLRGHQFTDPGGRYTLETIVPGLYPGRTRHIHVRVQAPGGRILTTQIYFPGEPRNHTDPLFRPDLLMAVEDGGTGKRGRFHFVLDRG